MEKAAKLRAELDKIGLYIEDIEGVPRIPVDNPEQEEQAAALLGKYGEDAVETVYSDELVYCDTCCDNFLKDRDDGVFLPNGYVCESCIRENAEVRESVVEYATDNPDFAIKQSLLPEGWLESEGWNPSGEGCETSLYKTSGKLLPKDVLERENGKSVLFVITDSNPFGTDWTYYTKPRG